MSTPKQYNRFKESVNLKQTRTMVKDMQNLYSGSSRAQLINYIKKQGNVFKSDKNLDKVDVKHFIISPISPELYSKLSTAQRDALERESRDWIQHTFASYGFIAGIEYNKDKSDKNYTKFENIKKGFHIHTAVSSKYIIRGTADLLSLRESLTRHLAENLDNETRLKLGIKNKQEIETQRRENIAKTKQFQAIKAMKASPEYQENNEVLQSLNKDLGEVFDAIGIKYTSKNDIAEINKRERYSILSKKDALEGEMKELKKSIKFRDSEISYVDKHIETNKEHLTLAETLFQGELIQLKHFYNDKTMGMQYYTAGQHRLFKKILKTKLTNETITKEQFLAQVADNKSYWRWISSDERKENQRYMRYKQKEFKKRLDAMAETIREYQRSRSDIQAIKKLNMKELEKRMKQYSNTNDSLTTHYEVFIQRMDVITKEIDSLKNKSISIKKQKLERIHKKKELIQTILDLDTKVSNKGMNTFIDATNKKHDINITTGKYKQNSIDPRNNTIHANSKKQSEQFLHIVKGISRITKIPDLEIIKSIKTKKLFEIVKKSIYKKYPSFKEKLEYIDNLEEYITLYDKLKKEHISKEIESYADYSSQLRM